MRRYIFLIFILAGIYSCKEVFEAPPQALLDVSFLNSTTNKAISPKVTIWGDGLKYLWVKDTITDRILLPLSTNDTTVFLVSFDSKIDILTITHETLQKYASMETGFYYEFKLKNIDFTLNRIDSIRINDSLVTKTWNENITLYLRPLPSGTD
jgi:hypothetical protein